MKQKKNLRKVKANSRKQKKRLIKQKATRNNAHKLSSLAEMIDTISLAKNRTTIKTVKSSTLLWNCHSILLHISLSQFIVVTQLMSGVAVHWRELATTVKAESPLSKTDISQFSSFCVKDSSGRPLAPVSAVCCGGGTLFMFTKSCVKDINGGKFFLTQGIRNQWHFLAVFIMQQQSAVKVMSSSSIVTQSEIRHHHGYHRFHFQTARKHRASRAVPNQSLSSFQVKKLLVCQANTSTACVPVGKVASLDVDQMANSAYLQGPRMTHTFQIKSNWIEWILLISSIQTNRQKFRRWS